MTPQMKALLRKDFLSFARKAIQELDGTKIGQQPYLRCLASKLDQLAEGEIRRLLINLPPGHLKTQLGSVCLPAWLLAHQPSLKIIIVTHAEHLSTTIARNIRTIALSPWFKEVFKTRIPKGHAAVEDFGTTAGGGVFVTSFRGRFTGRRADIIIVDDPHDISDSPEEIADTIKSFNTVLMSRLNSRKTGRVLVVAHRVHEHDLSSFLLKDKKWALVVMPMIATRDQTYDTASGKWRRHQGELLRPDAFDPEDIEELRANSVSPDFDMLYQQDCDLQSLPSIRAEHFPTITELLPPNAPVVLSVDPGMTNKAKSAFSVVQVWRVGTDRHHLLDQFREQCDYSDLLDEVRRYRKKYGAVAILIERAANGHALISALRRKYSRKLSKLIRPIDPDGRSKSARLRAHAETIIAKRIHLPADVPWRDDYIAEFVDFPHGKFTDQVDATTQFLDQARELATLQPSLRTHGGSLILNSGARSVTFTPPGGGDRGLGMGRHSDGRPISGQQLNIPVHIPSVWIRK
jgi:predicted phage terminase large subunit-like protein